MRNIRLMFCLLFININGVRIYIENGEEKEMEFIIII